MKQRFDILRDATETNIAILPSKHEPFHPFNLTVGQDTEDESFDFRLAFTFIDIRTSAPP